LAGGVLGGVPPEVDPLIVSSVTIGKIGNEPADPLYACPGFFPTSCPESFKDDLCPGVFIAAALDVGGIIGLSPLAMVLERARREARGGDAVSLGSRWGAVALIFRASCSSGGTSRVGVGVGERMVTFSAPLPPRDAEVGD